MPQFDLGTVFGRFFKLMGANFGVYALIGLVANIVPFVLFFLAIFITFAAIYSGNSTPDFTAMASNPSYLFPAIGLGILIFGIPGLISYSMISEITILQAAGKPAKAGQAFSNSFRNILPLLVIALLVGLMVSFGLLFLLIPGIFLAVCLSVAMPAYIGERNRGIFGSISRSFSLTEGKRWWLVLIHFVSFVLMVVLQLSLRFGLMGQATGSNIGAMIAVMIVSLAVSIVLSVAMIVFSATIYVCLRESKEGVTASDAADVFS